MRCPHCGRDHPESASYCPTTGKPIKTRKLRLAHWIVVICIMVVIVSIGIYVFFRNIPGPITVPPSETAVSTSEEANVSSEPTLTTSGQKTAETPTKPPTIKPTFTQALPTKTSSTNHVSDWRHGKLAFVRRIEAQLTLYELNLEDETTPRIIASPEGRDSYWGPSWSPDGTKIAFYVYKTRALILDVRTSETIQTIDDCNSPTWSPDGDRIICGSRRGGEHTFLIMDAATGEEITSVNPGIRGAVIPFWSPVRDEIVFAVLGEEERSIWRMGLYGEPQIRLAGESSENYTPAWSPDGEWIAYQSNEGSADSEIWIMDRNGEREKRITYTSSGWSRGPTWSPDGRWLAFVSNQAGSIGDGYGEVFIVSADTSEQFQVTFTGGQVGEWRVSWGR